MLDETTRHRLARYIPNLTAFAGSACVMLVELVAGRLASRYLGQSLYTWTAVIGVVLAGITIGNVIGGRLADRYKSRTLLAILFLVSAGLALLTPLLNYVAGHCIWVLSAEQRMRVFMHVAITFLLPAAAMGTIGPVAANMAVAMDTRTGRALGSVYAWSAAGSIFGTFLTGFYLVTIAGTASTLILAAGLLAAIGLGFALSVWSVRRCGMLTVVVATAMGVCSAASGSPRSTVWIPLSQQFGSENSEVLFLKESPYALISVTARSDLRTVRKLSIDRLPHSEVDIAHPTNFLAHYTWLIEGVMAMTSAPTQTMDVLVIGGGGYALPRYVSAVWPGSDVKVAEIDPVVTEAAISACGLDAGVISIEHRDGRQVVQAMERNRQEYRRRFDYVIGDTVDYYSLPYHLATREFDASVSDLLAPRGMYLLHIVSSVEYGGAYLGALLNTMEIVFERVMVMAANPNRRTHASYLFVGTNVERSFDGLVQAIRLRHPDFRGDILGSAELASLRRRSRGLVLTDDFAPVEHLVRDVVRQDRDDLVAYLLQRSQRSYGRGLVDGAERDIRRAVESSPDNASTRYALACLLRSRGQLKSALNEANHALENDCTIFPARILKGELLALMGDVAAGRQEWQEVLAARPRNLDALTDLAYAEQYEGDIANAVDQWRAILSLSPSDPTAHLALARLLAKQGRMEESEWHMREARRTDPNLIRIKPDCMPIKTSSQALDRIGI